MLCGSAAFIEKERAYRRMVGGGMRQAGVMAAAGIVALETMADRLADDHRRAKRLAEGLHAIDPQLSDPRPESNIVMIEVGHTTGDAKAWIAALGSAGLQCGAWSRKSLRMVTHRHIDDAAVDEALDVVRKVAPTFLPKEKVLRRA